MTMNHFVVSERDSVWQFSFKGDRLYKLLHARN